MKLLLLLVLLTGCGAKDFIEVDIYNCRRFSEIPYRAKRFTGKKIYDLLKNHYECIETYSETMISTSIIVYGLQLHHINLRGSQTKPIIEWNVPFCRLFYDNEKTHDVRGKCSELLGY